MYGLPKNKRYTVRNHIIDFLQMKSMQNQTFLTHDLQNLSEAWFRRFNHRLGSTETYTREFRRMRKDGILEVEKMKTKGRQQTWKLKFVIPF